MDFKDIFNQLHPDFFSPENSDSFEDDSVYEEMILASTDGAYQNLKIEVPEQVSFRFLDTSSKENMGKIRVAVEVVEEDWIQYFQDKDLNIFCGFYGDKIASFCLVDDFGTCVSDGKNLKVGGPGCVGTVPEFRRQGIGLKMVQIATKIVFDQGFDLSWIHWTGVAHWYGKLGYKTILKWNKNGFVNNQ